MTDLAMTRQPDPITAATCSIGVVTYLGRFKTYFQPLITKLNFYFPDYEKIIWLNGHHDTVRQVAYLQEATSFLGRYRNIRYITYLDHQPLARAFNWLAMLAKHENILILNDDVGVKSEFRCNLEKIAPPADIYTLNGTWSHFVMNKRTIKQVGWFDERFQGIGWEDTDYVIRLKLMGMPPGDVLVHGLEDYHAPAEDAGWAKISPVTLGKYSELNWQFFQKKWRPAEAGFPPPPNAIKVFAVYTDWWLRPNYELLVMPGLYPREVLEAPVPGGPRAACSLRAAISRLLSFGGSLYRRVRRALSPRFRQYLGPRLDYLKIKSRRGG
jgi:hypothetical protein